MSLASLLIEEKKAMLYVQETREKAQRILQEAERKADEILRTLPDDKKISEELESYRNELEKEVEEILREYREKAERIKLLPDEVVEKAVKIVIEEVLKHEL